MGFALALKRQSAHYSSRVPLITTPRFWGRSMFWLGLGFVGWLKLAVLAGHRLGVVGDGPTSPGPAQGVG